ncbi:kinesin KIF27 [Pelobates cultripes]|uniref:Kinesin KIF27 n=1 Tax=Pelobates cultripes TaxID=61616 RepID=A0AAD1S7D3_PELCU|nr:kinesin KIF27 [Pelobates cultripes]
MEEIPVKVAVRIRPLLSKEILHNHQVCVRLVPNTQQIIIGKDRVFTFDFVFGKNSAQDDVYRSCIQPLLVSLIEGYNATVFAYGQTGSGKTYTIGGGNVASVAEEDKGIIPHAVEELFQKISEHHNVDLIIKVSYIEVYKEELRDLLELETNMKDIHIREDEKGNTVIVGAKECQVKSADEVMSLLESGSAARHTSTTQMNEHSSRSHAIFTINICQQRAISDDNTNNDSAKSLQMITSKFHFVDLAGSERVTKTGNTGERFKESIQINSGLLALGNVISALADPKRKSTHVPYRDAKITRILKDSLGGNAKTVMITCISPSSSNFDETLNSLKYANRARNIKNKPIVNYNPEWDRIDEMELEIKALREALQNQQSSRVSRISQVSQDWSQDKDKKSALEEQIVQFQIQCFNYRHCTEEALELFLDVKDASVLTQTHKNRLQSWLNMTEGMKNELATVPRKDSTISASREEPHHITIFQLKRELRKCQEALATDEDVFARKEQELKELQEKIQSLFEENQENQKYIEELKHTKNLQLFLFTWPDNLKEASPDQMILSRRSGSLEVWLRIISQNCNRRSRSSSRRPCNSFGRYSFILNFRIKRCKDVLGNDAQSINGQYAMKISQLEQEAHQAKADLAEAQRQLQEMENKELRDIAQKAKLQKDFRKKMEAAKLKVQVLQKKQQDTKKLASISIQNEKRVTDVEQNIGHMRQQYTQLQRKLKEESEKKKKLELAVQKDQQYIKELQLKTEQQQKMLKHKNEEIAAIRRRKSSSSMPDQLQLKLEEQKKWLDEEVEKVLKERQALNELNEELKKKEESIAKKELLLQEKSHLEIKKLRSSQALNSDLLKLSNRLSVVESELTDKSKKLNIGDTEEQRKVSMEVKLLQKERDHLLQRRDSLDEKLKNGRVLSPEEEHTLFQLEEGIDALEAAIDYKNECIQRRQQSVKDSTQIFTQSEANILDKFSSLSVTETRSIFVRYFNKVVSLRESERKLQLQSQELSMKVAELENIVRELESALDHLTLQSDRQLTQQQKEYEQKMQLLLQHFKEKDAGAVTGNIKAYEAKIEELEKELFFYKKTSREFKKKLREVVGDTNMASKNSSTGYDLQRQNEIEPATYKLQLTSQPASSKPNKKTKETSNSVPKSRQRQIAYRAGGGISESDEQPLESRRQPRRHLSSGDDGDDIEETDGALQTKIMSSISKVGPIQSQLGVTPIKISYQEVRQISLSELSARRSSIGSIPADSIEM